MKDDQNLIPAFPTWKRSEDMAEGMTLRDYFAAAALTGLLADPERNGTSKQFALDAFALADAMMKQRSA